MSAEEFILVPRSMYIQDRPVVEQVLHNPLIASREKQLSLLQRYDTHRYETPPPEPEHVPPPPKTAKEKVFDSLVALKETAKKKSSFIYDRLEASHRLSLDNDGFIQVDNVTTGLPMSTFLHTLL